MHYSHWKNTSDAEGLVRHWYSQVSKSDQEQTRITRLLSCAWLRHREELLYRVGFTFVDACEQAVLEGRKCDATIPNFRNSVWHERNLCRACIFGEATKAEHRPIDDDIYNDDEAARGRMADLAILMRDFLPFQRIDDPPGFSRSNDIIDLAKAAFSERGRSIPDVLFTQSLRSGCCRRNADKVPCDCLRTARLAPLDNSRLAILADALEEAGLPTTETVFLPERLMVYGQNRVWNVVVGAGYTGPTQEIIFSCKRREQAIEWAKKNCGVDKWGSFDSKRSYHGEGEIKKEVPGRVLAHLRSHGPHFRGCWALEFVLRGDPIKE